jgi:uncharacterized cupredoxin-like copper-binding protein
MKFAARSVLAAIALGLSIPMAWAMEEHRHEDASSQPEAHGHEHGQGHYGQPGEADQAQRTIAVTTLDTMKYEPSTMTVKPGETIRFVVRNTGKLRHEFVIGDPQEQRAHAEMMKKMPGMVHEDPNALSLAPGETKTLIWQFGPTGLVEVACHVPGHYEAGMVAQIEVEE